MERINKENYAHHGYKNSQNFDARPMRHGMLFDVMCFKQKPLAGLESFPTSHVFLQVLQLVERIDLFAIRKAEDLLFHAGPLRLDVAGHLHVCVWVCVMF